MRKRINNDFDALVEVSHEGVKIDLSLYEITSVRMVSNQAYKVTHYEVRNGSLFLHVTPLIVPKIGRYKIVVTYRMADPTLADGFWNFEFDKYLVTIVGSSEEEDAGEVVITADAVIGMRGKSAYQVWLDEGNTGTVEDYLADIKGDPLTYDDLTPEQKAELKGDKGDPFEFSDFTPEQITELKGDKGDPLTYDDLTPEQKAELKGDKGDPFLYSDFTPEQIEALKGDDGNSAYEIWLSLGNQGTEQDFIDSLAAGGVDLTSYLKITDAENTYQPKGNYLENETDPTVPAWAKEASKPTYEVPEIIGLETALSGKVDDNQVLTNVPENAKFTDTVYTHPDNHPASIIVQNETHRFVTDEEKSTWNQKQEALGFTAENVSNKKTTLTDSDTDYPTTKAVNEGLAGKANTNHTHDDLLSLIYAGL